MKSSLLPLHLQGGGDGNLRRSHMSRYFSFPLYSQNRHTRIFAFRSFLGHPPDCLFSTPWRTHTISTLTERPLFKKNPMRCTAI